MMGKQICRFLERSISALSRGLNVVGIIILMLVMFLTVADVSLRYLTNQPIPGAFEITEFLLAILASFGLAYTALQGGHVTVGLVVDRFSLKTQRIIDIITCLLSIGVFATVTWAVILYARSEWKAKVVSTVLLIPRFPFIFLVAFGCTALCLALLVCLIDLWKPTVNK